MIILTRSMTLNMALEAVLFSVVLLLFCTVNQNNNNKTKSISVAQAKGGKTLLIYQIS